MDFDLEKQPKQMNWFLSHRQITGQRIALSLYLELTKIGETAFLDVKCDLDLHDLEKLVELCDFFVFIYSDGIFASEYCRKGIFDIFIAIVTKKNWSMQSSVKNQLWSFETSKLQFLKFPLNGNSSKVS